MPGNKNKRTVTMFYLWNTYFLRISAMCALLCLPTPPMTAKVCNSLTQHHILCNFYKHQQKACHKKNIISPPPPPKKKAVHSFDQFCWSESFLCQRMVWWVMLFVTCLGTNKKRRSWSCRVIVPVLPCTFVWTHTHQPELSLRKEWLPAKIS